MASHCERSTRTRSGRYSLALRCLLLLLVWQGPIPWCHCHDTAASSSPTPWLAKHLQKYHAGVDLCAPPLLGWHLHARLPGVPSDDPGEPTQPDQEQLPVVNSVDSLTATVVRASIEMSTPHTCLEGLMCGMPGTGNSRAAAAHFFDSFAPNLALPMRLCVSRT